MSRGYHLHSQTGNSCIAMQLRELKGRDLKKRERERGEGCIRLSTALLFSLLLPQSQKCPLHNASYALRIGVSVISGVPRCFQKGGGGGGGG